ncbi:hydrolase or metal-binding protein, partial [Pseudomonas aeruginosa]
SAAPVAEPPTTPKPTLSTLLKARAEARTQHAAE